MKQSLQWVKVAYYVQRSSQCLDDALQSSARRRVTVWHLPDALRNCRAWAFFVWFCTHTYTHTNNPRNAHWICFKITFSGCYNISFIGFTEIYWYPITQQILFVKLMAHWSNMFVRLVTTIGWFASFRKENIILWQHAKYFILPMTIKAA